MVVLTGAAGGIGRAIAATLAAEGAVLALVDRDEAGLEALVEALPRSAEHSTHAVDLARTEALDPLAEAILARHGGVQVLVHNAGLTVHGVFADLPAEDVDRVLDVDLLAPIHLTRALLPRMLEAPPGHVVLISSLAGMVGFPFQGPYSAAKSGLRAFGQALRPELAARGIGVSTVLPGTIATRFLESAKSHDAGTSTPLGKLMLRFGTPPQRVARAVRRAILRDRAELRVGWDCHAVALARWLCPPLVPWILRLATAWAERRRR